MLDENEWDYGLSCNPTLHCFFPVKIKKLTKKCLKLSIYFYIHFLKNF